MTMIIFVATLPMIGMYIENVLQATKERTLSRWSTRQFVSGIKKRGRISKIVVPTRLLCSTRWKFEKEKPKLESNWQQDESEHVEPNNYIDDLPQCKLVHDCVVSLSSAEDVSSFGVFPSRRFHKPLLSNRAVPLPQGRLRPHRRKDRQSQFAIEASRNSQYVRYNLKS